MTAKDGVLDCGVSGHSGCVSQGQTKDEAIANREAIALCIEVRAEKGLPLTIETRQVEVVL